MITITELFRKVTLNEASESHSEAIGHLPHVVEPALVGNHEHTIKHLENALDIIKGKSGIEGSHLSQKADGKVSIVFGKENGVPFVQYKGSGAKRLRSVADIKQHTMETGKGYLEDSFMMGLKAASHPHIDDNTSYQADTMIDHSPEAVRGNIIKYKKPSGSTKSILAVHTTLKGGKNTQSGAPNLSHLESEDIHFPNLDMKNKKHRPSEDEIATTREHIAKAKKLFKDPNVSRVMKEIAKHKDETNKTGHRHLFFREFNNKFQNGEAPDRSIESLMDFAKQKLAKTDNKKEKERILGHINYVTKKGNSSAIGKMLQAHSHADAARDQIIKVLNRSNPELKPLDPDTGKVNYNFSEGFVSDIPGHGQVKFVPREFSMRNRAESAARKIAVKEDMGGGGMVMTASGGGVAGMGYNLGGPAPDDVAVAPLKNRMASKKARPFRRKLMTKLLGRLNVGREAY